MPIGGAVPEKHRILAQVRRPLAARAVLAAVATVGSVSVIGALSSAPDPGPLKPYQVVEALNPDPKVAGWGAELPFVREEVVKAGDSLRSLAGRLGIDDDPALEALMALPEVRRGLGGLRAGQSANAVVDAKGRLQTLGLPLGPNGERLRIGRAGDAFTVVRAEAPPPTGLDMRTGTISSSLYAATDAAGVPDPVANQLVELFGTEIDFHTDLRRGDTFRVVFEVAQQDGRVTGTGRIVAAEFVNQGHTYRVYLFRDNGGREDYFTDAGRSLRQGFLRSPLEFSRVTSGFSMRRHPILQTWRQHQGVDFGAPTGTAVKATSDGTVEFFGNQQGYGNIIVLQHRDGYSTAYAHLSRFASGLRRSASVTQGQVIGYVGQSGWATGPHLHYEFRVAGVPKDPLTVALPNAAIPPQALATFRAHIAPLRERLALLAQAGRTPLTR
ncbi:MAG: M23 family metallopeptidase [Zoogloeaceae bacterium]|nr:M23 family metallopeptidase [Zoogloeaceae bacterium]